MKNTLKALSFALLAVLSLSELRTARSQTIPLSLDNVQYCAIAQSGNNFTGVRTGTCPVAPPPPAGRYTTGSVTYGTNTTRVVDLTQWIWNTSPTSPTIAWPGYNQIIRINGIPKTSYVSMKFTTTAGASSGLLTSLPDNRIPSTRLCISLAAGDFNGIPGNPGSCATKIADGGPWLYWKVSGTPNNSYAMMQPNTTYYLNIKAADPNSVQGTSFPVQLTSNH